MNVRWHNRLVITAAIVWSVAVFMVTASMMMGLLYVGTLVVKWAWSG